MPVVVDASIVLVLASGDPRREAARRAMDGWLASAEHLHAPALLPYEVASGLARLVKAGMVPAERLAPLWAEIDALPIAYHSLATGSAVTELALSLGRSSAYDAAYLALARELDAELWAFDGPLVSNAASLGFTVRVPR